MISAKDEEVFGIFDFVGQEQADSLQRLLASVHVVAKEEVICFWRETAIFKQPQKIIILTMNVALII